MATKTKSVTLTVLLQEGDFEIMCESALSVKAGEDVVFTIDVIPVLGFNAPVEFSVSGGPVGMTVAWQDLEHQQGNIWQPGQPIPNNLACVLTVPLDNALVGDYTIEVTGTSL